MLVTVNLQCTNLYCFGFQVGLAVDDIKGVQEQAVLKRLAMQVSSDPFQNCEVSLCDPV